MTNALLATVITDASYCHDTGASGWAVWLRTDEHLIKRSGNFTGQPSGPGEAELWAMGNGLFYAKQIGATYVVAQTDCLDVVDGINLKRKRIMKVLDALKLGDMKVEARHVRGHTRVDDARSYCNRWCDKEAGIYMRKQRKERGYTKKKKR